MPRSNETVLEGAFAGTEVILEAVATTFVRIGGGCVTEQQLTSEMSSGFVGSRISLRGIGTGLGFDLRTSALSAEWSSPALPPNGPVAGAGDAAVAGAIPAAVDVVVAGHDINGPPLVSCAEVVVKVVGTSLCVVLVRAVSAKMLIVL